MFETIITIVLGVISVVTTVVIAYLKFQREDLSQTRSALNALDKMSISRQELNDSISAVRETARIEINQVRSNTDKALVRIETLLNKIFDKLDLKQDK